MFDRQLLNHLLPAAVALAVLAGGTAAIGSELWRTARTPMRVVQLDRVVVTAKRLPASAPLVSAHASAHSTQPSSRSRQ